MWSDAATLSLGAALLVLAGCSSNTAVQKEPEEELAWVESADAATLAAADEKAGRLRFLEVCGYACLVPAVADARKCFPHVTIDGIEGTGDVIRSERHRRRNDKAWRLAKEYNEIVLASERRRGHDACAQNQ